MATVDRDIGVGGLNNDRSSLFSGQREDNVSLPRAWNFNVG